MDEPMATPRLLTRRRALALLGASGAALLAARHAAAAANDGSPPACIVRPRQTEGPFFVEGDLERPDLRLDPRTGAAKPGAPLRLAFRVSRVGTSACSPLTGAQVHIWHCDAAGEYSPARDKSRRGIPARLPDDRCGGNGAISDDLPGLVSRTRGPRALQDPHRRSAGLRVHLPALFRRVSERA